MKEFFIQIKCEMGRTYDVAHAATSRPEVVQVFSISGDYDLLVRCRLDPEADIGHFVTGVMQRIGGVRDTFTIMTYSMFEGLGSTPA